MHACGHDVHATWAIGAARLLAQAPAKRDVIIILQQAEELATGAKFLLDEGALPSSIAAIFGAHVDRRYAVGQVVHHDGAISTYSDKFYFTVTGKSAHAARPKEGINPIPEAANLSKAIIDATTPLTNDTNLITITQVHGGSAHNIIPATVEVSGTIRCLDSSKRDAIKAALTSLQGQRNGCEVTLRIDSASPAVLNDASLSTIEKMPLAWLWVMTVRFHWLHPTWHQKILGIMPISFRDGFLGWVRAWTMSHLYPFIHRNSSRMMMRSLLVLLFWQMPHVWWFK